MGITSEFHYINPESPASLRLGNGSFAAPLFAAERGLQQDYGFRGFLRR
jgi:hypothetical protein